MEIGGNRENEVTSEPPKTYQANPMGLEGVLTCSTEASKQALSRPSDVLPCCFRMGDAYSLFHLADKYPKPAVCNGDISELRIADCKSGCHA